MRKTKLLGNLINNDLQWDDNTKEIKRMCILRKVASFKPPRKDLGMIYIKYLRSIKQKMFFVWHSSLTAKNREDIERVKKNNLRVIQNLYKHIIKPH